MAQAAILAQRKRSLTHTHAVPRGRDANGCMPCGRRPRWFDVM